MAHSARPLISVIIPTKNSGRTLARLLESVSSQSYKRWEVIIVDNKSSDNTTSIARKFTKKVFQKGPERSVQRNFGVSKASGSHFLFLDSDMILTENVLSNCMDVIKASKEKVGAIVIPEKSFGENFWAKSKAFEREINEGEAYFEAARFFPKAVFEEFNGYATDITGPEDWDLPLRVSKKYKIKRIKSYILHDEGSPTPLKLMKRKYYYGLTSHVYLLKNNISAFSPQTIYFLRPAFYKQWKKLLLHPLLTSGMITLLFFETLGGGIGYMRGRFHI